MDRYSILDDLSKIGPHVKRSDIVYRHMRDSALLRYYYKMKTVSVIDKLNLEGSSPTDIFIGRHGYPKVSIGPLVPPEFGDTSLLGTPERWWNKSIEEIVDFRSKLVRGMQISNVYDVEKGMVQEHVRDLALADRPAGVGLDLASKPFVKMEFNDEVQPFGPSAKMRGFDVENVRADTKVENKYSDTDAKASTAIVELYREGLNVSKIQRGLSAGLFGLQRNRKFVPTRWSITAVDDTISKDNLRDVKAYDSVDAVRAYYNVALDNRWLIFFIPGGWEYESIEAWYPHTVWNEDGVNISIFGSHEGYYGRKKYAEIGGCYYAARLAVTEKLKALKSQARVLILREAHPGYSMPVGVWNVREHVRETLATTPEILHSSRDIFAYIATKLSIRPSDWMKNSAMLTNLIAQRGIAEYVK